jgi:hypothetical protein
LSTTSILKSTPQNFQRHLFGKWLIGATHHSLHHKQFKYNYGLYFTFWDKWKKTESPLYSAFVWTTHSAAVDFNAEVKPIINKKCISCHGGVKREGGFSLLFRSEALAKTKSGKFAIIPGDPDGSEMIRRLHLKDPEERMPYKREPLSKKKSDILRRWIKQGAEWGDHWAYVAVKEVTVPKENTSLFGFGKKETKTGRATTSIILFWKSWKQQKLAPAPEADKATLLRRVSLDLTGLPPSQSLAQTFLKFRRCQSLRNTG